MKLAVGLVVKGGEEFIDRWIEAVEKITNTILVVDNGADKKVIDKLITHPSVKQYHKQNDMGRNQSRDYQKILEMAREENCTWIWNIDIDEIVPEFNIVFLMNLIINCGDESIGFPLFEMRNDNKHYTPVRDIDGAYKDARLVHKCYKILSHFKFDEKDIHGVSIPHNCKAGAAIASIPIQHYGHYSKELRDEKRKLYTSGSYKDFAESTNTWLEEDESKIEIRQWEDFLKKWSLKK